MVLRVGLEVHRQLVDALREQRGLNLGRAGVGTVPAAAGDDLSLLLSADQGWTTFRVPRGDETRRRFIRGVGAEQSYPAASTRSGWSRRSGRSSITAIRLPSGERAD